MPEKIRKKIKPLHIKFFKKMETVTYKETGDFKWKIGETLLKKTKITTKVNIFPTPSNANKKRDEYDVDYATLTSYDLYMMAEREKTKQKHSDVDVNLVDYYYNLNDRKMYDLYEKAMKKHNSYTLDFNASYLVRYMVSENL